ncbi:MAG: hypothetical protein HFI24_10075 [Lachnospiraceae bacterium]|nr:hypothetical protein [Lachnospiraceae bacterium]MCI9621841.1 hypothetical protein [Lachnospiraceae bacterium]
MNFLALNENELEFLNIYMGLTAENKQLAEYIMRIGASKIFSNEEYADLLELLKK